MIAFQSFGRLFFYERCCSLHNRKTINAWCMYDWANSVYNLVITTTFFPIYFAGITKSAYGENSVPFLGRTFKNTAFYDYRLLLPISPLPFCCQYFLLLLTHEGIRKSSCNFFATWELFHVWLFSGLKVPEPNVLWGVGFFMLAAIGFVGSLVFIIHTYQKLPSQKKEIG
jgi:UMF1 family MFS transporter